MPQSHTVPLPHGIADELITEALAARLTDELVHVRSQLDPAEADRRIAQHVAETVARAVRTLPADNRAQSAAELANRIIDLLATETDRAEADHIKLPPETRLASYQPTLGAIEPTRPETPLRDTILFTNSPTEPNLASEIGKEMSSADRVDALIAFVKWSGLRLIADQITDHLKAGKPLRVITTT